MNIIDHSNDKVIWRCRDCRFWQDLNHHKPCVKCGYDPFTPTHAMVMKWVKKEDNKK